jgi:SulP family sulfate permease
MTAMNPEEYAAAAAALALAVGAVALVGRSLRMGFVADLLSRPVLVGYLAGVGVLMITSQLGTMTGVAIPADDPLGEVGYLLGHLEAVNRATLLLAVVVTGALLVADRWRPYWPNPLIAMLGAAALTVVLDLGALGIETVGPIPAGLPRPALPGVSLEVLLELALPAVGVAVVGYTDNVLTARAFASRHRQHVDADQELLALGAANVASGLTQGFPVSSSGSRTAIADALGVRTQLHSLVAAATVVLAVLTLRPVLASFPRAALAGW